MLGLARKKEQCGRDEMRCSSAGKAGMQTDRQKKKESKKRKRGGEEEREEEEKQ